MIDVDDIVSDDDFTQEVVVYRSSGSFIRGAWVEGTTVEITMLATVTNPNPRDLQQVSEGDRIRGGMVFHTTEPLYVTRTGEGTKRSPNAISDRVLWKGEIYKLSAVLPYSDYGYYKAIGERIKGS